MQNWLKLIISLALPQMVGGISAYFTSTGTGSWYQTIRKPEWNPPDWLFAPVWTALYIMMGIAFYLIWKEPIAIPKKRPAVIFWSLQLSLNFFWSFLFFNQHQIGWSLIEIVGLWLIILITIFLFARIRKVAAWLFVPYISWVTFAGILTFTIWKLNT